MTADLKQAVLHCLQSISPLHSNSGRDGEITGKTGENIVSLGLVSDIFIADNQVFFAVTAPAAEAEAWEGIRKQAEQAAAALPGVRRAIVSLTAEKPIASAAQAKQPMTPSQSLPTPLQANITPAAIDRTHISAATATAATARTKQKQAADKQSLAGIKHIIAVASGKGGVGKSTTAVNLAIALQQKGLQTGLLDADIYGPSLPKMLGITKPEGQDIIRFENKKIMPLQRYGLKLMSMGFLTEQDAPLIWRGPMVMSAVRRLLFDVSWSPLDILVVDMPPGTGDAQLTLAQNAPLSGAVIVSTPQELALIDARKGLEMFAKIHVPILGIVENMSCFIAPDTGKCYHIFGNGGAQAEARRRNVPFLGSVPITPQQGQAAECGIPLALTDNREAAGAAAQIYQTMAANIMQILNLQENQQP